MMFKRVVLCLAVIGLGLVDAEQSECYGKLEKAIRELTFPLELSEAVADFMDFSQDLAALEHLPATFQRPGVVTKYLRLLSGENLQILTKASGEFLSESNEMLKGVDCDQRELNNLIDVDDFAYEHAVKPLVNIDIFNGYYELSRRIVNRDLYDMIH